MISHHFFIFFPTLSPCFPLKHMRKLGGPGWFACREVMALPSRRIASRPAFPFLDTSQVFSDYKYKNWRKATQTYDFFKLFSYVTGSKNSDKNIQNQKIAEDSHQPENSSDEKQSASGYHPWTPQSRFQAGRCWLCPRRLVGQCGPTGAPSLWCGQEDDLSKGSKIGGFGSFEHNKSLQKFIEMSLQKNAIQNIQ